jgi:hypothetical protein
VGAERNRLLVFCCLAVANFLLATVGFDVFARMAVGQQSLWHAVYEHFYYAGVQPIGTLLLLAPFLGLAVVSGRIAPRNSSGSMWLFCIGALFLTGLYFRGFYGSQQALQAKKWTAAALSVGLLPFQGAVVLLVCGVAGMLIPRRRVDASD